MIKFKCSNCSFSFSEADKVWDKAIKNSHCPKCKTFHPELDFGNKFNINTQIYPIKHKLDKESFYKRLIISALCWGTSFYAILASGIVAYAFVSSKFGDLFWAFIYFYPWVALLVMNIGWIKNYRVNLFWPYSGTFIALCAVVMSAGLALLFAPLCIILAIWLVIYHLRLGGWNN